MFTVLVYFYDIKILLSKLCFLFFYSFSSPRGFVVVQSSGIETLVEELCSKLKDLQSKQGKEKNV